MHLSTSQLLLLARQADWWSLGVILYECLIGYPPFFADDSVMTCRKILHWQKCLTWPADKVDRLSPACLDFVKRYARNLLPVVADGNHYKLCAEWRFSPPLSTQLCHVVTRDALARSLMSPAETRLGRNGIDEIKAHPFFSGVDWVR